ncbi:aldo/keto reductase [Candidatus Latescibacterota bacterium]
MGTSSRRDFLISGTTAGIGFTVNGLFSRRIYSEENSGYKIAYRELGSTGYKVSEIGFGALNTRDPELIHSAIDKGINFIDTAHSYMKGVNEQIVGQVMKTKRNKVFLTTKLHTTDNHQENVDMLDKSLKRLQTDHVDLLLYHNISERELIQRDDQIKFFDEARQKGKTRFVGVSTHNPVEILDASVESKFWEAVLIGYNYLSPPDVDESIKKAHEAGLAIIGMINLRTIRQWEPISDIHLDKSGKATIQQALLKWVLQNPYIDTTIPGMASFEHLADDLAVMGMELSFDERRALLQYDEDTKGQYCCGVVGCNGCKNKCPNGVKVNEINRCINYAYGYGDIELAHENYNELSPSNRVDVCDNCDECVVKCVNGLNLTENIQRARKLFG